MTGPAEKNNKIQFCKGIPYPLGMSFGDGQVNFAAEMKNGEDCGLILYRQNRTVRIPFRREQRTGDIFSGSLRQEDLRAFEGYRFYDGTRSFIDSYAKCVSGNEKWGSLKTAEKCRILGGSLHLPEFEWGADLPLRIPYENSILYCLHVRGFTKHVSSQAQAKGTFAGIIEKIPYLRELGVTGVELMPCYEFLEAFEEENTGSYRQDSYKDKQPEESKKARFNCWGYKKGFYFSPKASYSSSADSVTEMKTMIQKLHENGIEVIMQFYFPEDTRQGMIPEILRYWVSEYHVDGIHLMGKRIPVTLVATDPLLADTKLMYHSFPMEEIDLRHRTLALYRDDFLVTMRRFLKGDSDMLPDVLQKMKSNPASHGVINYLSNYFGFSLYDMTAYEQKHNEANGEENRDGTDYNFSWNCGAEGRTRKKAVMELRSRQLRNAMCFLMFSQGTPLFFSGDEFLNSRNGNNNVYCQDNEMGWVNWSGQTANTEYLEFVKALIALRKKHPILHPPEEFRIMDTLACGYPDLSYHGEAAWRPILENYNRHIGLMYCGKYAHDAQDQEDNFFFMAFNMHWIPHKFALPKLPGGYEWQLLLDTERLEAVLPEKEEIFMGERQEVEAVERSVQVYIGVKKQNDKILESF